MRNVGNVECGRGAGRGGDMSKGVRHMSWIWTCGRVFGNVAWGGCMCKGVW